MTTPQEVPMFDTGNPLLDRVPANMTLGTIDTPAGKLLVLTVRTSSATLTVLLTKDDAKGWAKMLDAEADGMNGLQVVSQPRLLVPPHRVS